MSKSVNVSCGGGGFLWFAAVVYTFIVWGFWWGMLSIIFPFFPVIDIVKYLVEIAPWLQ